MLHAKVYLNIMFKKTDFYLLFLLLMCQDDMKYIVIYLQCYVFCRKK